MMYTIVLLTAMTAPGQCYPPAPRSTSAYSNGYGCYGGARRNRPPPPRPRGRALDLDLEDGHGRLRLRLTPANGNGNGNGQPPAPGLEERREPYRNGNGGPRIAGPDDEEMTLTARRRTFASCYRAGYYPSYFRRP